MSDETISISELEAMASVRSGPCRTCGLLGYVPHPGSTDGRMDVCADCAGTGNALTVPAQRLASAVPTLIAIVKAALGLETRFDFSESVRHFHDPEMQRLIAALSKVRP